MGNTRSERSRRSAALLALCIMVAAGCSSDATGTNDGGNPGVDGAGGGDSGTGKDAPAGAKRIFITAARYKGDLKSAGAGTDGLDGGDRLCDSAAKAAGLGGSWTAWLSSGSIDAIARVTGNGPWYTVAGVKIFADKKGLEGSPLNALWHDEAGKWLITERIWTGTIGGGLSDALGATCVDWTSAEMTVLGKVGQVGRPDGVAWTAYASTTCDQSAHLICLQQ